MRGFRQYKQCSGERRVYGCGNDNGWVPRNVYVSAVHVPYCVEGCEWLWLTCALFNICLTMTHRRVDRTLQMFMVTTNELKCENSCGLRSGRIQPARVRVRELPPPCLLVLDMSSLCTKILDAVYPAGCILLLIMRLRSESQ